MLHRRYSPQLGGRICFCCGYPAPRNFAFGYELLGMTTMRELELRVENHQITVNMIDTKLSITYQLSPEGHLEENTFWTLDGGDAGFRQRAWQAAHSKARQLAWIPRLKSVASERPDFHSAL